jgi:hypothetical protein
MIVGDVMVVTTGYTGDDFQDFADQSLVYDLRCRSWHKPDLKGTLLLVHLLTFSDLTWRRILVPLSV